MKCQVCNANDAHVHVIDVAGEGPPDQDYDWTERHVCQECAARMDLPSVPSKPEISEIWKLLEQSAKRRHLESGVTCPHCGMTLAEFRAKGRLGCPYDYDIFREHLDPLLERIHNAAEHVGRIPGGVVERSEEPKDQSAGAQPSPVAAIEAPADVETEAEPPATAEQPDLERRARRRLRRRLERKLRGAVDSEDYELAANLRDELQSLTEGEQSSGE